MKPWFRTGSYVYVKSGPHTGGEGRIDFLDMQGERALVDFGGGRKGGLTWVALDSLHDRSAHYVRSAVRAFAHAMETTLRKHDHKGGWNECDPLWLLGRLEEEVRELKRAVGEKSAEAILSEATDVANFAMMVADVCQPPGQGLASRAGT